MRTSPIHRSLAVLASLCWQQHRWPLRPTAIASSTHTRTTRRPTRRVFSTRMGICMRAPALMGAPRCAWRIWKPAECCNGQTCRRSTSPRGLPRGAARSFSSPGSRTLPLSTTASASACCAPSHYKGEGWGLTEDGRNLILSDGTATLRFLDPGTFHEVRHIVVKDHGSPVTQLNELEYVRGEIYANVWHTDRIARISPATGQVLGGSI